MKKLRTHLENSFFIFVKFLVHIFQNISFKEKTFVAFFPLSNLTLISTVNFGHMMAENFIISLLNKFYK